MNPRLLTDNWDSLHHGAAAELQLARLRHYLENVVLPHSAHYRNLFASHGVSPADLRRIEDLQRVPFTTKADLINTPEHPQRARDFLLIPDQQFLSHRLSTVIQVLTSGREAVRRRFEHEFRPVFMTSTTGRSADPIPFLYSKHDLENLERAGKRLMEVCEARPDFRLINMFPYAPHLAFWLTHYASTEYGVFSVGTGGGKVMGSEGNIRLMQKLKPDVLIGMPTFIYHVLQQAVADGLQCPSLKRLVLGGEKAADGMRRKLKGLCERLGAPAVDVVATYGLTEAKMAWAECPRASDDERSGYHLYPDLGIYELIDPATGNPVPEGHPGELVFTPLDSRGTVVLRYRTGDLIEGGMTHEPCPYCGRTAPRLLGNISRSSEVKSMQLDKIKGTLVDFNCLEHVLDNIPHIGAWQLEIRKLNDDPLDLDELVLHVQKLNDVPEDRLTRELNSRFVAQTEIRPNRIVYRNFDEMSQLLGIGTQLKEQRVIDHRPAGARAASPARESTDRVKSEPLAAPTATAGVP